MKIEYDRLQSVVPSVLGIWVFALILLVFAHCWVRGGSFWGALGVATALTIAKALFDLLWVEHIKGVDHRISAQKPIPEKAAVRSG